MLKLKCLKFAKKMKEILLMNQTFTNNMSIYVNTVRAIASLTYKVLALPPISKILNLFNCFFFEAIF